MATMVGGNCRVKVWQQDGSTMELHGCMVRTNVTHETLDVTSAADGPFSRHIAGPTTVEMIIRGSGYPRPASNVIESMAAAAWSGDIAAAQALADLLLNDIARQSEANPRPTHDELSRMLADRTRERDEAMRQVEELQATQAILAPWVPTNEDHWEEG